jgi:hypothetical protein
MEVKVHTFLISARNIGNGKLHALTLYNGERIYGESVGAGGDMHIYRR